jgi:hypothetical protein
MPQVTGAESYLFDVKNYPSASFFWTLYATDGAASGGTVTIDMPDLTVLPGWDAAWNHQTGTQRRWTAETWVSNGTFTDLWDVLNCAPSTAPRSGLEAVWARHVEDFTPQGLASCRAGYPGGSKRAP